MPLNEMTLELITAADEPHISDPSLQEELNRFSRSFRTAGANFSQLRLSLHAIDSSDYNLAEFLITHLATPVLTAVAGVAGAWVHARYGRKVRVKVGDIEAEASTPEEIERLLKNVIALRDGDKSGNKE